ncbi:hypothetical protein B0H10DRAFT_1955333 [Mycena sp. CBHHK59/15]|nr:hypothetical protein B0H10DRAFT_1955333 [Mycena sp. CBHHK59/15]
MYSLNIHIHEYSRILLTKQRIFAINIRFGEYSYSRIYIRATLYRRAIVLPAITLEPEEVDFALSADVGIDLGSFNPMALRQRRELDSIMETDSQFPGPAENDPPELAIQHAPTLDLQPQIAQHPSEPAHGLPRQQLILSFATTLPMQYTTGSSGTRDSAHPPKKLKLGVAGNARKGKTCALCAHANCSDANTCPGRGKRASCWHKLDPLHAEMGVEAETRRRSKH